MGLADFVHLVNQVPDEKLAEMAGVSIGDIEAFRAAKGDEPTEAAASTVPEPTEVEPPAPGPEKSAPATPKRSRRKQTRPKPKAQPVVAGTESHRVVRLTKGRVTTGPNGRTLRLAFRDVFSGEMAQWVQVHHADICEPYPPKG